MNTYKKNTPLVVTWKILGVSEQPVSLYGKSIKLKYRTSRGENDGTSDCLIKDDAVEWTFPASQQKFPGIYSLELTVFYPDGSTMGRFVYNNAFQISEKPIPGKKDDATSTSESQSLALYSYSSASIYELDAAEANRQTIFKSNEASRKSTFESSEASRQTTFEKSELSRQSTFNANEATRQASEDARKSNETARQSNESTRNANEKARQSAEAVRETTFNTNEANRQSTFEAKEATRQSTFDTNEATRQANETVRQTNETARQEAEASRQSIIDEHTLKLSNLSLRSDELEMTCIPDKHVSVNGWIANGIWYNANKSILLPICSGAVKITMGDTGVYYCVLKSYPSSIVIGETPDFATGYSDRVWATANSTTQFTAPSDAKILILGTLGVSDAIPISVQNNGMEMLEDVNSRMHDLKSSLTDSNIKLSDSISLLQNEIKEDFILEDGNIDDSGKVGSSTERKYIHMLPVVDGYGYAVCGCTPRTIKCYSAPHFSADSFLGSTIGTLKEGTRYVAIDFLNSQNDYSKLRIVSLRKLDIVLKSSYIRTRKNCIEVRDTTPQLDFYLCGLRGFYLYGDVDTAEDNTFMYQLNADKTTLRIIIYKGSSNIIDKTISVPANKIIDYSSEDASYGFRIIADVNNVDSVIMLKSGAGFPLGIKAFSPIIGNLMTMESDISALSGTIEGLTMTMNNPDDIYITTDKTEQEELSSDLYIESGYVSSIDGTIGPNSLMVRTGFISTQNLQAVATLCPAGSSAGIAFYSTKDVSSFISGVSNNGGANGKRFLYVPNGAKYFRTTALVADTKILSVLKYAINTLTETLDNLEQIVPRSTRVLYGYEGFVDAQNQSLKSSRITISSQTDAKQIVSKFPIESSRFEMNATFLVNDASSYFGLGVYYSNLAITEFRVKNDSDKCLMEIYAGASAGDTYEAAAPRIVLTKTCKFSLTTGQNYNLSIRRFENQEYNGEQHIDGVLFTIESFTDNIKETLFIPRDSAANNGIRNGLTALIHGYQYVTVKGGSITLGNLFVSSEYAPQAKVLILGDSFVDGDTLISQGGQQYKYAALLQEAIGQDVFVVSGKGGEALNANEIIQMRNTIELFSPKYVIIALGGNNSEYDSYKIALDGLIKIITKYQLEPILTTIPPVGNGARKEFMTEANNYIKSLGYRYVDINAALTTDGVTYKDGYILSDGTHPTVAGHQAIYDAYRIELPEIFNV